MRTIGFAFFVCLALSCAIGTASAAVATGPSPLFEGKDLFGLQWASDPQIHPDGRTIAYVRNSYEVMTDKSRQSIWLIDVASGQQSPLVSGAGTHVQPRWSPDGTRLAYLSSAEGRTQLYVKWLKTGTASRIADLTDSPLDLTWSPDGRSIAFRLFSPEKAQEFGAPPAKPEGANWAPPLVVITNVNYRADGAGALKPGYTHTYVVSADGGAPRQLTFGELNDDGPLAWSKDGKLVYFTSNRTGDWQREPVNNETYSVSVSDGTIKALTSRKGPDNLQAVSPDGSKIAYLSFEDKLLGYQNVELYVMDADGSNARSLTASLDRSIDSARWAADGNSIYVQYADHGVTKIARVSLKGKVTEVAAGLSGGGLDRPYSGGEFSVAKDGSVAITTGDPGSPSNIAVARNGRITRLTNLNEEFLRNKRLGAVRPLEVKSSFDQRAIDAWLVTPPDFDPDRKYPLILEIHGGPFASYGPLFSTDDQLYAAAGYIVLYTNPRGSTSYGEEFANLIHHDYPDHDYDDLMSAVDAAIGRGFVDEKNLFVTGGSGGGVLTAWIVGRTDRFRAAVAQKPVINWTSFALTTDMYTYAVRYWFTRNPWEDPDAYWKR
jgi:dipeptidyl aminopeptidase/acylaminoacyl peptidase